MILNRRLEHRVIPVVRCCQLLGVSRSFVLRKEIPSEAGYAWHLRLEELCLEFPGYGYRRVSRSLFKEGFEDASESRVRAEMRRLGLGRRSRSRRVRTTDSSGFSGGPNLAKGLKPDRPGQLLVADLTYLALPRGFAYLSVVLDAFTRRVLGWNLSRRLDASLPIIALQQALEAVPLTPGWICHSDRGTQYNSRSYRSVVESAGGLSSFSRPGNPYDNAVMESFFKTLKTEEPSIGTYQSLEEANASIMRFIDLYNTSRLHSALGYRSPEEFEQLHTEQNKLTVH